MGGRGDMGGEYGMGMAGPMGGGGGGPRMGHGPGMGRGGGMYEVVEQDLGDGNVYHVQFKRSTRNFLLGKTCQRDLQVRRGRKYLDRRDRTGRQTANHGRVRKGVEAGRGEQAYPRASVVYHTIGVLSLSCFFGRRISSDDLIC